MEIMLILYIKMQNCISKTKFILRKIKTMNIVKDQLIPKF